MVPASTQRLEPPRAADLFTPKLITVLREGYSLSDLRADVIAGLTVAIVALPLSMAIAIASGVTPERGLYTAAVGGFLISALGGSRFQIGGPAAAFTVLVAGCVARNGVDGLFLATLMAGAFLLLIGVLRLGSYVKFIPYPVTVGFISGIAVILFIGQIGDLLGLHMASNPADIVPKLEAIGAALPTLNSAAVGVSIGTVLVIVGLRRYAPQFPGILIAVVLGALVVALLKLPVETIGTRFGGIPNSLPAPHLPAISVEKVMAVLPDAVSFALLGAIESLLSAMVADGMTGRRHRSNMELVAQGIANMASALFGGICATGTVARTATNVRSGARSPLAGMFHAVFVVLFMVVAAPLASFIPLAGLAGVLAVVAWNMIEKPAFAALVRTSWGDAMVLLITFGLTVVLGLTPAIIVGFALGALLFLHRMAQSAGVEVHVPPIAEDEPDEPGRPRYDPAASTDPDVAVYRITGAFFFGAAASVGAVLDRIADRHKALVLDFSAVPFIDSTAANTIEGIARKARRSGVRLLISGAGATTAATLAAHGVRAPEVQYVASIDAGLSAAHAAIAAA
ncbi:MAG: sodium-independent anion transporter [Devosia sp. 67-54]|uniref:SulP family inorganic anion transporter n=1 Tax=unclassified Devosia TaxID=196773 RepID=UPI00095C990F|nr:MULTISPECIES: SulP family inorganic anion transporter [unclassified Devosia]MBN9304232.1 STAS domain-containing protein [Devosia sp.]OJX18048.1 MAG: sodium-independent anion transporter [Devosia sp. 67-54]